MTNLRFVLSSSRLLQLALLFLFTSSPVLAQVVPDSTLPIKSDVNSRGNAIVITGGSRAGTNLFHSFQEFSVLTGSTAYFNNSLDIRNIIGRVTGGSVSNIDGLLKANGTANLFLINPNGLFFGRNASLNIGGSFVGSTASSLKFADGTEFSATAPQNKPLLTISAPIGLRFGPTPGDIGVQGPGAVRDPDTTLLLNRKAGLRVQPNQTLALVGGSLSLQGSILTTDGGRIELGGVAGPGIVILTPVSKGWSFSYEDTHNFRDIKMSQQAAVDASGRGGGDIQVQGDHVVISGGSQIEASTVGSQAGGTLAVIGSHAIEISGTSPSGFSSGIFSDVYPNATGGGDNLIVKAGQLIINDGGTIESATAGQGQGGDLVANVLGQTELSGTSPSGNPSSLFAATQGAGNAGKLTISTGDLILTNGAQVNTNTTSQGRGGDLFIQALNSVKVLGQQEVIGSPQPLVTSLNTQAEQGSTGRAGNITVTTGDLVVANRAIVGTSSIGLGSAGNIAITTGDLLATDGGQLQSATGGRGQAGNLAVNAFRSIDLRGSALSGFPSGLFSLTQGSGNGGNLLLSTAKFKVSGGAVVSTSTSGQGNAGNISLRATESVALSGFGPTGLPSAFYTSSTGLGQAGNIKLDSTTFSVSNAAVVSAATSELGAGGSITINANVFKAENGGQVLTSTSGDGNAGNITLNILNSAAIVGSDPNYTARLSLLGPNSIVNQGAASGLFANNIAPGASGRSGSIFINSRQLVLNDGASIAVNSFGKGEAGILNIQAGTVSLDTGSSLSATTASTEGGNINLQAPNLLLLRHGSQISTTAGTTQSGGDGGNITIKTPAVVAVPSENSDITANSFTGKGGNINITAQGIFGIQSRNQDTPLSDITASSQFGVNGTVRINTLVNNSTLGLVHLPIVPVDAAKLIAQGCGANTGPRGNKFVVTGSGGLPPEPTDLQTGDTGVQADWVETTAPVGENRASSSSPKKSHHSDPDDDDDFVEATGMIRNAKGQIEFVAQAPTYTPSVPWIKSPSCHVR